jgi:hypothetical protein
LASKDRLPASILPATHDPRFVRFHPFARNAKGDPWDHHFDIELHRKNAKDSDQPFVALVKDLKSRGLFEETLIVCGSEFGRQRVGARYPDGNCLIH